MGAGIFIVTGVAAGVAGPAFLKKVHPKPKVPHIVIFFIGGIVILLSIFGTLAFVISVASFAILLYYNITNIAVMKM